MKIIMNLIKRVKKYLVRAIIAFLHEKATCRPCFEFEPLLFEPGVYFNIKCIEKWLGLTNEFERSLVFETGEFERPMFDCTWSSCTCYKVRQPLVYLVFMYMLQGKTTFSIPGLHVHVTR